MPVNLPRWRKFGRGRRVTRKRESIVRRSKGREQRLTGSDRRKCLFRQLRDRNKRGRKKAEEEERRKGSRLSSRCRAKYRRGKGEFRDSSRATRYKSTAWRGGPDEVSHHMADAYGPPCCPGTHPALSREETDALLSFPPISTPFFSLKVGRNGAPVRAGRDYGLAFKAACCESERGQRDERRAASPDKHRTQKERRNPADEWQQDLSFGKKKRTKEKKIGIRSCQSRTPSLRSPQRYLKDQREIFVAATRIFHRGSGFVDSDDAKYAKFRVRRSTAASSRDATNYRRSS